MVAAAARTGKGDRIRAMIQHRQHSRVAVPLVEIRQVIKAIRTYRQRRGQIGGPSKGVRNAASVQHTLR